MTRIGIVGTSWWSDSMYLPALRSLDGVDVPAVLGRNPARTADFAANWEIPRAFTDTNAFFEQPLDAVIIASANHSHHPLAIQAIDAGLDVLCEKPLGLNVDEAREMAAAAAAAAAITLVPFTYRYMPVNQYLKRLIDEGYLGEAFHLGLRYFTGFARNGEYAWRFDRSEAGSGVIGDIGSHFLYLARWFFGEVESIGCLARSFVSRDDRPDGRPYERGEDSAVMTLEFVSGAYATVQASAVCHEPTPFGQVHEFDAHGSAGTLHAVCDWDTVQHVRGVKVGESGPAKELPIPDDIWNGTRRGSVHDTYRDVFRGTGAMIGDFVQAVRTRQPCEPDFADGLRIQELCDAAVASAAADGTRIRV
ncbi:MAG: Gfo/Idh/MocA family protein [Acidimicrobiales bacterium]|jgi:predicted dehydrogenase